MKAEQMSAASFLKRDDESLRDYLLSFSPFAPFFGVQYRFAGAMPMMPIPGVTEPVADPMAGESAAKVDAPEAPVAEKPKAEKPVADKPKAEPSPKAAPKPAAKAAPVEAPEKVAPEAAPQLELEAAAPSDAASETAPDTASETDAPALLYDEAPDNSDDLKKIRGIGPKLERELNGMGVYTYAQIAAMSEANLLWIDDRLTSFKGRSIRDDWIGQASELLGS